LPDFLFKATNGVNQEGATIRVFYEDIKFLQTNNQSFFCLLFFSKERTAKILKRTKAALFMRI